MVVIIPPAVSAGYSNRLVISVRSLSFIKFTMVLRLPIVKSPTISAISSCAILLKISRSSLLDNAYVKRTRSSSSACSNTEAISSDDKILHIFHSSSSSRYSAACATSIGLFSLIYSESSAASPASIIWRSLSSFIISSLIFSSDISSPP